MKKEKKITKPPQSKMVQISIPEEALNTLTFGENGEVNLTKSDHGLLLSSQNKEKSGYPIKPLSIVVIIALVIQAVIFSQFHQIPLSGYQSIATIVVILGALTGMINFTITFIKGKKKTDDKESSNIYWRNFPTVLISYTVLLVLVLLYFFKVVGSLFVGATFDVYTATLIGTVMMVVINIFMISAAQSLTPRSMIRTLIIIIIGGVYIAMITNKDQQWWTANFSFLGTPEATNAWQFNVTLMLSALLMIALIDYLFVLLYHKLGKINQLRILKTLLVITAICLGGVGFFPYNDIKFNQIMHNQSAAFLVYLFIILIIGIRWLLPGVKKEFLRFSYVIGIGLALAVFLFQGVHYLSLTAFELMAFILAFTWLLSLLSLLVNIATDNNVDYIAYLNDSL